MQIFKREQVTWLAAVAAVFHVLMSYNIDTSGHVQGIVTALIVFVFGVVNAFRMHDGVVALVTGVLNALFALFVAFDLNWTVGKETLIVGAVTLVLGLFTRQNVVNPTTAAVSPAGKLLDKAAT